MSKRNFIDDTHTSSLENWKLSVKNTVFNVWAKCKYTNSGTLWFGCVTLFILISQVSHLDTLPRLETPGWQMQSELLWNRGGRNMRCLRFGSDQAPQLHFWLGILALSRYTWFIILFPCKVVAVFLRRIFSFPGLWRCCNFSPHSIHVNYFLGKVIFRRLLSSDLQHGEKQRKLPKEAKYN